MSLRFEWDPQKNEDNVLQHHLAFEEAITVFDGPLALMASDPTHSLIEHRWSTIGRTRLGRLVVVFCTERGDTIRLISARPATKQERRFYEEKAF